MKFKLLAIALGLTACATDTTWQDGKAIYYTVQGRQIQGLRNSCGMCADHSYVRWSVTGKPATLSVPGVGDIAMAPAAKAKHWQASDYRVEGDCDVYRDYVIAVNSEALVGEFKETVECADTERVCVCQYTVQGERE